MKSRIPSSRRKANFGRVSASRREARQPRLSIKAWVETRVSAAPRREGRNPRLSSTKARGSKPASQSALQYQGAWVDTRVSVVTVPVIGSITAHITGKVSPHYGVILGGTYAPETSINSPVAMEKGSDFWRERRTLREKGESNPSENLLRTS